jgi:transglutaminase-like putative cysteine protease
MHFTIRHESHYTYNQPVYLEPHLFRLRPRSDPAQRLLDFNLAIDPPVAGQAEFLDIEGNSVIQAWFDKPAGAFSVTATIEVETLRFNPFDFIVTDSGAMHVPARYDEAVAASLTPYVLRTGQYDAVTAFATSVLADSGTNTVGFLATLASEIRRRFAYVQRQEGSPRSAAETLMCRSGACRDLAMLYVETCRSQGLAARFVSGFCFNVGGADEQHLHAWAEVYLPGGGWRGFDPTTGLAVADHHVAVAASPRAEGAAPITGFIRGNGATSNMKMILAMAEA